MSRLNLSAYYIKKNHAAAHPANQLEAAVGGLLAWVRGRIVALISGRG